MAGLCVRPGGNLRVVEGSARVIFCVGAHDSTGPAAAAAEELTMLQIDPQKVCYLIIKAREFDAKVAVVEPDPGSNPSDENMRGVLEDYPDDPVDAEIRMLVDSLNEDEQIDLVTLLWLGRAETSPDEWNTLREEATAAHSEHTADYLLGTPLLSDYLSEGLNRLGYDCSDFEIEHL